MFLYPNRESRTKDPLGVKMMRRRTNKKLFMERGLYVTPNATYQIELPSGRVVTFEHQHEAERFKRRAYQSGLRLAYSWTVDTIYRTTILDDCSNLAKLGEAAEQAKKLDAEYGKKLDAWWADIDARNKFRNPPTNPATYEAKGIAL